MPVSTGLRPPGDPPQVQTFSPGWAAAAAIIGGTALVALHAARYGSWLNDDAAITFAYARDLAIGAGPVPQPGGDPVEGFSNPAWLVLLTLAKLLGLFDTGALFGLPDYVLFPKLLSLACVAGTLAAFHAAARELTRRPALLTFAAGAVMAAIPSFVMWTVSGLENPLYTLAVCWLASLLLRAAQRGELLSPRVAVAAGLLAALAALTRPDGVLYVLAHPLVLLMFRRLGFRRLGFRQLGFRQSLRLALLSVAVFAAPFGAYLLWRVVQFGRLVPNTAVAKSQGPPTVDSLARVGELIGYTGIIFSAVVVLAVVFVLRRASKARAGLSVLLLFLLLATVVLCVLGPEPGGELRFATPFWALGSLVAVFALSRVFAETPRLVALGLVVATLAAATPTAIGFARTTNRLSAEPIVPMCLVAERFGRLFNGYADVLGLRGGTLLVPDVGGTLLTSRLRVVDVVGLTHAKLADLAGSGRYPELRDYVFDEVKPTFVHSHQPWSEVNGITADPRLERDYFPVWGGGHRGDWVRKDSVGSLEKLDAVRKYAEAVTDRLVARRRAEPRNDCGDVLRPGQLP